MLIKKNNKLGGFLLAVAVSCFASSVTAASENAEKLDNPLLRFNNRFREIYAAARSETLKSSYPVIICFGDRIELLDENGKKADEFNTVPDLYTLEKSVAHIPLCIYCLLEKQNGKLDEKTLTILHELKVLVEAARADIAERGLSAKTLERQQRIIDSSLKFINDSIAGGCSEKKSLDKFAASLSEDLLTNAYEAISSQLSMMDKKVAEWKTKLGTEKFSRLKVVIPGGHMPRQQNSCFQYFARLLNVKEEGDKIIYAEGLQQEEDSLKLLGTHILDESVAVAFFHDRWRMHRDLLSDGARRYLKEHPPLSEK